MPQEFALLYFKQKLAIARIVGRSGTRCSLVLPDGGEFRCPEGRLLLRWEGAPAAPPPDGNGLQAELHGRVEELEKLKKSAAALDTAALHRKLRAARAPAAETPCTEPEIPLTQTEIPFTEIVAHALPGESDGWARAALYMALLGAPRLFRHGRGGFAPKAEAEIEAWDEKEAAGQARKEQERQTERWRGMLERGEWKPEDSAAGAAFLGRLGSLLAEERSSPHWNALAKPLGLRAARMAEARVKLKTWLRVAGRWEGWPAVWLQKAQVSTGFEATLEKAARALAETYPHPGGRADLRGLGTFTIDTPGTRDPDDACSVLAADDDGVTVALHIAEPPAALRPGHPLFEEAARRAASVYTVEGVFPMLPFTLVGGRSSLKAGKVREAATFTFRLSPEGEQLLSVERSLIRVERNLDYGGGDALLRSAPETWGRLADFCEAFRAARLARGAVAGGRAGVAIDRSDPERVKLKRYDRDGPAQRMVEELAILLNREAGRYCRDHGLPAIYRVLAGLRGGAVALPAEPPPVEAPPAEALPAESPPPESPPAESPPAESPPEGNRPAPRPRYSLRGRPHAGLAADRYVQVTSPLRRFADLVMQQQILRHAVTGEIAYDDPAQLGAWAEAADARMAAHAEVERRIEEHWKRVYLSQNPGQILAAEVRRAGKAGAVKVWLEAVQMMADARLAESARPGAVFSCRVVEVDLDRSLVRVEPT